MLTPVIEDLDDWNRAQEINKLTASIVIPRAGLVNNRNSEHRGTSVNDHDRMTDWSRAIKNLWQQIRWLKKFALVNKLAMKDIKQRFMRSYFRLPDNSMDKQLKNFYKHREFSKSRKLKQLTRDLAVFYSLTHTDGNL